MVSTAITAFLDNHCVPLLGKLVTAVLPGGCPLNCPFCIVNQLNERLEQVALSLHELAELVLTIGKRDSLGGAAIVGDEPLQKQAWSHAESFLNSVNGYNIPRALITNGFEPVNYVSQLTLENMNHISVIVIGVVTVIRLVIDTKRGRSKDKED